MEPAPCERMGQPWPSPAVQGTAPAAGKGQRCGVVVSVAGGMVVKSCRAAGTCQRLFTMQWQSSAGWAPKCQPMI